MTVRVITAVWVPGHPKTKGSLTFYGKRQVEENVQGSADWRLKVAEAVRRDIARRGLNSGWSETPETGPVEVRCVFWLDPGSALDISSEDPYQPAIWPRAGDVDKLARNVLDACAADARDAAKNGGAFANDNQVEHLGVSKFSSAGVPGASGLALSVSTVDEVEHARNAHLAEVWKRSIVEGWYR